MKYVSKTNNVGTMKPTCLVPLQPQSPHALVIKLSPIKRKNPRHTSNRDKPLLRCTLSNSRVQSTWTLTPDVIPSSRVSLYCRVKSKQVRVSEWGKRGLSVLHTLFQIKRGHEKTAMWNLLLDLTGYPSKSGHLEREHQTRHLNPTCSRSLA